MHMCIYTFIYTHVHTYIHKHVQYIRHIKPKNIYITCIIKLHFIKLEITKIKRGNIQYTCYHKNKGSTSFLRDIIFPTSEISKISALSLPSVIFLLLTKCQRIDWVPYILYIPQYLV